MLRAAADHKRTDNAAVTRCSGTDEGNPRDSYVGIHVMIPEIRARQPRDGPMNCGSQSADISMIIVAKTPLRRVSFALLIRRGSAF